MFEVVAVCRYENTTEATTVLAEATTVIHPFPLGNHGGLFLNGS